MNAADSAKAPPRRPAFGPRRRVAGAIARVLLMVGVGAAIAAGLVYFFYCPCERTPGGYLLGTAINDPVDDWSFANDVRLCQIEVRRVLPHSVNLNCMAAADGTLYLSCSRCEGKGWSSAALENPSARIRIGDAVYPVLLRRVEDAATLDKAWQARAQKVGREGEPRPDHWWSFHVASS